MNNFLDTDSSFLDSKLRFVRSELEENLNELLGDVKQEVEEGKPRPFKIIKPDPGLCVKAHRITNNEKVFVNICTSDGIPPPEDISPDQLTEILSSETPSNYKIPMSITEMRLTPDKSGNDAVVVDVAIHPNFFRKIEALRVFREFLVIIIFEALDTKYKVQIDRDSWIVLKNRKCMGSLVKHRVQNRDVQKVYESYQNPSKDHKSLINELNSDIAEASTEPKKQNNLITEIDTATVASITKGKGKGKSSFDAKPKLKSNLNTVKPNIISSIGSNELNNNQRKPEYRLHKFGDASSEAFVAEFFLPEVMDSTEITLDLNVDRLVLESRRNGYLFDSFLPNNIDVGTSTAEYNNVRRVLTVKMPFSV